MFKYTDESYKLDREMILNTEFSELMFPEGKKFVDYIITYSSHLPFTNTKGVCKMLYDMDNAPIEGEEEVFSSTEAILSQGCYKIVPEVGISDSENLSFVIVFQDINSLSCNLRLLQQHKSSILCLARVILL